MRVAILDPFSGISGDMTLGALLQLGLPTAWLEALPVTLGLDGVGVRIRSERRGGLDCKKVDFDIPPQPHSRHIHQIRDLVNSSPAPASVRLRADAVFAAIATAEAEIHGVSPERVHLHEVGAVDAILDVVGSVWGFEQLGVSRVYSGPISLGDGFVEAAHGTLPVPAPATMKLLEGLIVRPGPEGSGELVTPTGAALVRVLSSGPPPAQYVPHRSGFGAGTKDFENRPNALRIVLAEVAEADGGAGDTWAYAEELVQLASDIDDMTGEYLAATADLLREMGALDVVLLPTLMKKGRPGTRVEILVRPADAMRLEAVLLAESSAIGVRRARVCRRALPREVKIVPVLGGEVRVKVVTLPDGRQRLKPEFEDVRRVALETGRAPQDIFVLAQTAAERS